MTTYTPLPAKWTPSTILKIHDKLLSRFMTEILTSNKISQHEKNARINDYIKWHKLILDYTMSGQMTYKKDAEKIKK